MAERESYLAGTPSWIDLGSPDPAASAVFYGTLFGWEISDAFGGDYRMCALGGRTVAGIGTAQAEGTPWWTTYVTVDDADATAKLVDSAGGTTLMPVMDIGDFGRAAAFADPGGARFSVWQPRQHHGAGLVNEPGTLTWNELVTRDLDGARTFYNAVFGWQAEETDMGGGMVYTTWKLPGADTSVGGAMTMDPSWPADLQPHWMVYFAVADCDASAMKAVELGGRLVEQPMDIPGVGRFAILTGPHGESFSIMADLQG